LKKLPDEVLDLPFPRVVELFAYWEKSPPEHEMLSFLAMREGWKPSGAKISEEEAIAQLRREQARRWASGQAMDARQIVGAGGEITTGASMWPPTKG
jgi:hypothetical protein